MEENLQNDFIELLENIGRQIVDNDTGEILVTEYQNPIDNLLLICKQLKEDINWINANQIKNTDTTNVIINSTKFLLKLRELITGEPLLLLYGYMGENGKIYERKISMDEVLSTASITFRKNKDGIRHLELQFSNQLAKIQGEEAVDHGIIKRVIDIANTEGITLNNKEYRHIENGKQLYSFFEKQTADINVIATFSGGKHRYVSKYYNLNAQRLSQFTNIRKNSKSFKYFNNGWLYEWSYEYGLNRLKKDFQTSFSTPLYNMMQSISPDNVAFLKAPDVRVRGVNYQTKFGSAKKLIGYNQLIVVLDELIEVLQEYKSNTNRQNLNSKLLNIFTVEDKQNISSKVLNKNIEQILQLLSKIKI